MGTQGNAIIGLGLVLALVVAGFLIFRNFDLSKIGKDFENFVDDAGQGLNEFVDDIGTGFNEFVDDAGQGFNEFVDDAGQGFGEFFNLEPSEEQQKTRDTLDIFEKQRIIR